MTSSSDVTQHDMGNKKTMCDVLSLFRTHHPRGEREISMSELHKLLTEIDVHVDEDELKGFVHEHGSANAEKVDLDKFIRKVYGKNDAHNDPKTDPTCQYLGNKYRAVSVDYWMKQFIKEAEDLGTVEAARFFDCGEMGIDYDDKGVVERICDNGQAQTKGMSIIKGAEILKIQITKGENNTEPYSKDAVQRVEKSGHPYKVTFRVASGARSKVYDIEPNVIRRKGQNTICPRDGKQGAAYVDCVFGEDNVGLAVVMLSYTWGYELGDIADGLNEFCKDKNLNPKKIYTWICCLCINQHRVKEAQAKGEQVPFDDFQKDFSTRVQGVGKIVALMAPWHAPEYIKRVWCDFEMFTAMELQSRECKVNVTMPKAQKEDLFKSLCDAEGIEKMWKTLVDLDVQRANASYELDKKHIFGMIEQTAGFHRVNVTLSSYLQEWMVQTCERHLAEQLATKELPPLEGIKLRSIIAEMLRKIGNDDMLHRAETYLQDGLDQAGKLENIPHEVDGLLKRELGMISLFRGKREDAHRLFEEAFKAFDQAGKIDTPEGVTMLIDMGTMYRKHEMNDEAAPMFERARNICVYGNHTGQLMRIRTEDIQSDYRVRYARALKGLGDTKRRLKNKEGVKDKVSEGIQDLVKAREVSEDLDMLSTPFGAELLLSIGLAIGECKGVECPINDDAMDLFQQAVRIRELTHTLQSHNGGKLLASLGKLQLTRKLAGAEQTLKQAKTIFEKTRTLLTGIARFNMTTLGDLYVTEERWKEALVAYEEAQMISLRIDGSKNEKVDKGIQTCKEQGQIDRDKLENLTDFLVPAGGLTVATWNVAKADTNPFEFWVSHENKDFENLMTSYEEFVTAKGSDNDVPMHSVFKDDLFLELLGLMDAEGWETDAIEKAWWTEYRNKKVLSQFMTDVELGKKRLVSMADLATSKVTIVGQNEPAYRPTVVNHYGGDLLAMDEWWLRWRNFMFHETMDISKEVGRLEKKRPCQMLQKLSREKYKALSEEEVEMSLQLQCLCLALYDSILVWIMMKIGMKGQWQDIKRKITEITVKQKHQNTLNILRNSARVDVICLQKVTPELKRFLDVELGIEYHILAPSNYGHMKAFSMLMIRQTKFLDSFRDITDVCLNALQATYTFKPGSMGVTCDGNGIVKQVSQDGQARANNISQGYQIVKIGSQNYSAEAVDKAEKSGSNYEATFKVAFVAKPLNIEPGEFFAVYATDTLQRPFMIASYHADSKGATTKPIVSAFDDVRKQKRTGYRVVFGIDAETQLEKSKDELGVDDFVSFLAGRSYTTAFKDTDMKNNCTTCKARTFLQPQLHKGKSSKDRLTADTNPRDHLIFRTADFGLLSSGRDNTGEGKYLDAHSMPCLMNNFPSDHGLVRACLQPKDNGALILRDFATHEVVNRVTLLRDVLSPTGARRRQEKNNEVSCTVSFSGPSCGVSFASNESSFGVSFGKSLRGRAISEEAAAISIQRRWHKKQQIARRRNPFADEHNRDRELIFGSLNIIGECYNPLEFTPAPADLEMGGGGKRWEHVTQELSTKFDEYTIGQAREDVVAGGVPKVLEMFDKFVQDNRLTSEMKIAKLAETKQLDLELDNKWLPKDGRMNPIIFALSLVLADPGKGNKLHINSCLSDPVEYLSKILTFYETTTLQSKESEKSVPSLLLWDLLCFNVVRTAPEKFVELASFSYMCQPKGDRYLQPVSRVSMLKEIFRPLEMLAESRLGTPIIIGCQEMPLSEQEVDAALPSNFTAERMKAGEVDESTMSGFVYCKPGVEAFEDVTEGIRKDLKAFLEEEQVDKKVISTTLRKICVGQFTIHKDYPVRKIAVVNFHCKSFGKQVVEQAKFVRKAIDLAGETCGCPAVGVGDMNIQAKWPNGTTMEQMRNAVATAQKCMMPAAVRDLVDKFGVELKEKRILTAPQAGTLTTLKMRTRFQGQPHKQGELAAVQKDFVFVPNDYKVSWYSVCGCPEMEVDSTNAELLQPSRRWPGDHFGVVCGIKASEFNSGDVLDSVPLANANTFHMSPA